MTRTVSCAASVLLLVACGGGGHSSRYPPRPEGCDVQLFPGPPPMRTANIGPVRAACDDRLSEAECVRELKDQACRLGADLVWGVAPPAYEDRKQLLSGRAAHTSPSPARK